MNNLFDIAHADVLYILKINKETIFLQRQRELGRPGHSIISKEANEPMQFGMPLLTGILRRKYSVVIRLLQIQIELKMFVYFSKLQKLDRKVIISAYCHPVYELILKGLFEMKVSQVTSPLLKIPI